MIFISFAGENAELARALGLRLRAASAEVWCSVFKDDLDDGHPWSDQIYAALDRCSVFVLVVTDAPLDGMTKEESDYARDLYNKHKRPRVVSVRLSEAAPLPRRYESLQSVVLPADWQSETSDFITKKLRQWGEIAAPAPAPDQVPKSTPPSNVSLPATPPPTPAPQQERAADNSREGSTRTSGETWATRLAPVALGPVLFPRSLGGRNGGVGNATGDSKGPQPQVVREHSRSSLDRESSVVSSATLEMVAIPAGRFLMGHKHSPYDDERPQHEVTIASYELARTEVTRGQWREVMRRSLPLFGWRTDRSDDSLPANGVTWDEAQWFCETLSDREGLFGARRYRLPSEAEWEYACRAGATTEYWSGDKETDLARVGWYDENSGGRVLPVGEKLANPWGLFDMHGNVWEWCQDVWHFSYRRAPRDGRAWVDWVSPLRVIRGGSFGSNAGRARSAFRSWFLRWCRWGSVGFRPARSVATD